MELRLEQRHGIPVSRCRAKKKKKLWEVITAAAFFFKKNCDDTFSGGWSLRRTWPRRPNKSGFHIRGWKPAD